MSKEYTRKTVFLYPEFSTLSRAQVKITNELITRIELMVLSANKSIKSLLTGGGFAFVNCLPVVSMQTIAESEKEKIENDNIRICILNYNEIDYSNHYDSIVESFISGQADISHLVAISLHDKNAKIQFEADQSEKYSVIIKTNIDKLEQVLISIMLDIALYHYFRQSNDLNNRKSFNNTKVKYISEKCLNEYVSVNTIYLPSYLPFSFIVSSKLEQLTNQENRNEQITKLINSYADFLVNYTSIRIVFNENGNIKDDDEYNAIENIEYIREFISKNCSSKEIIFVVPQNMTDVSSIIKVKYDEDSKFVKTWIDKQMESVDTYQIILATEGK